MLSIPPLAASAIRAGGCQCGAIRYRIDGDPGMVSVCHCAECQRQSGSAFGMTLVLRQDQFSLLQGTPKCFVRATDSGRTMQCHFCSDCGNRIYHVTERAPGEVRLKPGTLDDTRWLQPQVQGWTSRQQPWLELPAQLRAFSRQPQMSPRRE